MGLISTKTTPAGVDPAAITDPDTSAAITDPDTSQEITDPDA